MSSGETAVIVILRPAFAKVRKLVLWAYIWKLIHLLISANLLSNVSLCWRFYATVRTELQTLKHIFEHCYQKAISVEWSGEQSHRKMVVRQMDVWESRQTLHRPSDSVTYFASTFG